MATLSPDNPRFLRSFGFFDYTAAALDPATDDGLHSSRFEYAKVRNSSDQKKAAKGRGGQ